jgi:radical SAM superfamily enzyme YgiQ (UPF0313 family)
MSASRTSKRQAPRPVQLGADELLADEIGTLYKDAPLRIALVYPSPYRAAMSSLGYQQIYRTINAMPGVAADRAMLPSPEALALAPGQHLTTLEAKRPVGDYPMLAYSVAYELELAGVVETLERANIPALAINRTHYHPLVIAGGPLTFSNPAPMAPFFDVIVMGEGEELIIELVELARQADFSRERLWAMLDNRPGYYLPHRDGERIPPVAAVDNAMLPARSVITTPHTELSNMFLTEAARGCSRGCTYCVMRRSTNGGMRIVAPDDIIAGIPEHAQKVGLVGAAVTDHPNIIEVVARIVESNRSIGISSLRADKLTDELVRLLAKGGYRTLTVAADGTSERMRRVVERSTQEKHLIRSAELARIHGLRTLKVYMMVGVPGETDDDIDELVRFSVVLAGIAPRVAYGIAPFVAKRNTPLDGTDFAGIALVEDRLDRLRRGLRQAGVAQKVEVRPTSARWAWVEYMLAQSESKAGIALMDAHHAGGSFAAYKKAFAHHGIVPTGPRARVPSSQELIKLNRSKLATAIAT